MKPQIELATLAAAGFLPPAQLTAYLRGPATGQRTRLRQRRAISRSATGKPATNDLVYASAIDTSQYLRL